MGSNKESKGQPKCALVWRTGLSGAPPDSVRCTRRLQAELFTFGNSQRRFAIIHRTVRCTTGLFGVPPDSVRCPQRRVTLNSPASGFRSAKIHRTVRWASGATATSRATVDCNAEEQCTRGWHTGQSTGLVRCATGQLGGPTSQSSNGRNPTTRWRGWRTGLSGAPCDSSLHQTASLVVGVINTPNHPTFMSSKFSTFQLLTRALAFNSRHTQVIKSSTNSTQSFSDKWERFVVFFRAFALGLLLSFVLSCEQLNCNRGKRHQLCGGPCGEVCSRLIEKKKLTQSEGPFERGKGLKETRSLWPPQRGVGLRESNLGKTNHRALLFIRSRFVLRPLSRTCLYF
jgi:hypothetical protein